MIYNGAHFLELSGARMATGGLQFGFGFLQRHYLIKFRLSFSLLCLCLFALLCQLGVWQLHRYHFKKDMLAKYEERAHSSPLAFAALAPHADWQFQHVMAPGAYLGAATMLVQNRMHEGRLGFEVITPFAIDGQKKLLLIDRGWVQSLPSSDQSLSQAVKSVTGVIKLLNEYQFILGNNIQQPNVTPLVMQKIDTAQISRLLHREVYPFVLRLDENAAEGFVREWSAANIQPERHMGYAVQWFLMAAVLIIAYMSFCIERVRP